MTVLNPIPNNDIAIVAVSGRFPGAADVSEFWQHLCEGKACFAEFADAELRQSGIPPEMLASPDYVKRRPIIDRPDWFDPEFFGLSEKESERIDPQHRVFLECAHEVLETAGYNPKTYRKWIGVFGAANINTYLLHRMHVNRDSFRGSEGVLNLVSSEKDYLATRVSYKLNLRGPSISIQTACSSSLVAVHLACQSLKNHECDMALAGGVSIEFPNKAGYLAEVGGATSPSGRCRAYDASSDGTVYGDAAAIVLLKRLGEAMEDGDQILAVIKGSAVNNDGGQKAGYFAPGERGQAEVAALAHLASGVHPETIGYVEGHGTGTLLGDGVEVAALARAFARSTRKRQFCYLGSVKPNVGHSGPAAGIVSLVKTAIVLKEKVIPPLVGLTEINPNIALDQTPFAFNSALLPWNTCATAPRRAAVHCFGMGGTNAHIVLEEAPERESLPPSSCGHYLLPLSARTPSALAKVISRYRAFLEQQTVRPPPQTAQNPVNQSGRVGWVPGGFTPQGRGGAGGVLAAAPSIDPFDLCFTASLGREHFPHREAFLFRSISELTRLLATAEASLGREPNRTPSFAEASLDLSELSGFRIRRTAQANADILSRVADHYRSGGRVQFDTLYESTEARRVALPTYPFERRQITASADGRDPVSVAPLDGPPDVHDGLPHSVEEELVGLWKATLGGPEPLTDSDFFQLGGHSVLALELMGKIKRRWGVSLSLSAFLDKPTIRECVKRISEALRQEGHPSRSQSGPIGQHNAVSVASDFEHRFEPFELTDVQHAYWLGRQNLLPLGNVSCHAYSEYRTKQSKLDLSRLEAAWNRLITRHPMLRASVDENGRQRVWQDSPKFVIHTHDCRGQSQPLIQQSLQEVRDAMSQQVLDCSVPPLVVFAATVLPDDELILHCSYDLLFVDLKSYHLIDKELRFFYEHPDGRLPPLELTFRDYLTAYNEHRRGGAYEEAKAYWGKRIDSLPEGPKLPLTCNPGSVQKPAFRHRSGRLPKPEWDAFQQTAKAFGITPSCALISLFADLLGFYSNSNRFTLNVTLFNRLPLHEQVFDVVGDFTTINLLETSIEGGSSFEDNAKTLQRRLWTDLEHRLFSGIEVLRELNRRRKGRDSFVAPVVFTSGLGLESGESKGAPFEWIGEEQYFVSQTPQVWFDHRVTEEHGDLVFDWDVVEELFPSGFIDTLFESYCAALTRLSTERDAWTSPSGMALTGSERHTRDRVNCTQKELEPQLLHSGFEVWAQSHPDAVAVVDSTERLTYGELNRRANVIARKLMEARVPQGSLVAIAMHKGWEQIAAVLGTLKAGAAYLPVDPALPQTRLEYIFHKAHVRIALTRGELVLGASRPSAVDIWNVHEVLRKSGDAVEQDPPHIQSVDDLAYVIFTSGSTGEPKGVMISHRGAFNTITDINERFEVTATDRVLSLSALNFDLSVYDIFGMFNVGGAVVLPSPERLKDPGHWKERLDACGVTVWNTVPALMDMFVEYLSGRNEVLGGRLRLALLSGDWIPITLPDKLRALKSDIQIISLGGATEASIWSILFPIDRVDSRWRSIPYGKPLANQTLHVLDTTMRDCPTWVPGRLYIGGIGLALGYCNDEALTDERFVRHPVTGERLYWTGDLGRYLADGNIEFLGREDFQVKIQGYRIELEEIESHILQHPAVKSGVVAALKEDDGRSRLVGYYSARPHRTTDSSELRRFLSARLPAYMIPNQWVELSELPLSANGKVDRKALPRPAASPDTSSPGTSEPRARLPAESLIKNPLAKLDFKLSNNQLRNVDNRVGIPLFALRKGSASFDAFERRRTSRKFGTQEIPIEALGELLSCLSYDEIPNHPISKKRYSSAGGLYPVQTYLLVKDRRIRALEGGYYYYHPRDHQLYRLGDIDGHDLSQGNGNDRIVSGAALCIYLVADLRAIEPIYGREWATKFCLMEAGIVSHHLELAAVSTQLGICQLGMVDFDSLATRFDLGEHHRYLHCLAVGPLLDADERTKQDEAERAELLEMVEAVGVWKRQAGGSGAWNGADHARHSFSHDCGEAPIQGAPSSDADTDTTKRVLELWRAFFHMPNIKADDDFFAIGGDSMMLVRLANTISATLGVQLPISSFYDHPTPSGISAIVDSLRASSLAPDSKHKRVCRRAKGVHIGPISHHQEGLFFLHRLMPEDSAYNMTQALTIRGNLNVPALLDCLKDLVARHELLRTRFDSAPESAEAYQEVLPSCETAIPVIDLCSIPESMRDAAAADHIVAQNRAPFDLSVPPLFRYALLRVRHDESVLVSTFHHIICDYVGASTLLQELAQHYKHRVGGTRGTPAPPPIQYLDYVLWERSNKTDLEAQKRCWVERLQGIVDVVTFPTDRPRPNRRKHVGRQLQSSWGASFTAQLNAFCASRKTTLFATLMAGLQILLSRMSGLATVVIGTPITVRDTPELERLPGLFINNVCVRGDVAGDTTVAEFLEQTREQLVGAFENRDLPFEQLVDALNPKRHLNCNPLFQVMLNLHEKEPSPDFGEGVTVEIMTPQIDTAKFDLQVEVIQADNTLRLSWEYDAELYDVDTMTSLLERYARVLEQMASRPSGAIRDIDIVLPREAKALLCTFQRPETSVPDVRACEMVEQAARGFGNRIAIRFEGTELTYEELNHRAECMAQYLAERSIGPGTVVGISQQRSEYLPISLLAVMKTGAAFLPLDPAFPKQRLAYMLNDAAPAAVLCTPHSLAGVHVEKKIPFIDVTQMPESSARPNAARRDRGSPLDIAYILYTSGSTGHPKGVRVTHRNLTNFLLSMQQSPGMVPEDVLLSVTTISFDISILELLLPLICGAQVRLVPERVSKDGRALKAELERGITVMQATPSSWRMLLASDWKGSSALKILCGGEAMTPDLAEQLLPRCAELWNMYGPTETTIWSTIQKVTDAGQIDIGMPISNTQVFILDHNLRQVPPGVVGEICVAGAGVSAGYHHRPELTAKNFVDISFDGSGQYKAYRTGDLGKIGRDNRLLCLGRADNQVKLRGFRVELQEIEAELNRLDCVAQSAVASVPTPSGESTLLAFVVLKPGACLDREGVKTILLQRLPGYMVPSDFAVLDFLPLTANGKVDRKALPVLAYRDRAPMAAPPNMTGAVKAHYEVWCAVLGLSSFDPKDNFFDLGGSSILATKLVQMTEKATGQRMSVMDLFESPSLLDLVSRLRRREAVKSSSLIPDESFLDKRRNHQSSGKVESSQAVRLRSRRLRDL